MLNEYQIQELIDNDDTYSREYFLWQMNPDNTDLQDFFDEHILDDLDERIIAICMEDDATYADAEYDYHNRNWEVYTDAQATEVAKEYAQQRLEDELFSVPRHLWEYFNDESYIDDAIDDRGGLLGYIDGEEYSQTVRGTTYYLYKR